MERINNVGFIEDDKELQELWKYYKELRSLRLDIQENAVSNVIFERSQTISKGTKIFKYESNYQSTRVFEVMDVLDDTKEIVIREYSVNGPNVKSDYSKPAIILPQFKDNVEMKKAGYWL